MLGPAVWVLVMAFVVALGAGGLFLLLFPIIWIIWMILGNGALVDPGGLIMVPMILIAGTGCGLGAHSLAVAAARFAVGFNRIDLQPATAPTRVVLTGWVRRSVVEVADLSRVIVRYRDNRMVEYDEPVLELVLRAGNTTLVCPAVIGPLRQVDPQALADWLGEVLGPSEVPVCHHRVPSWYSIRQAWLLADTVALIWQVPVADVPMLADCCGVHTNSEPHTRTFNAYDVEVCAERARTIAANDQHEPPPQQSPG